MSYLTSLLCLISMSSVVCLTLSDMSCRQHMFIFNVYFQTSLKCCILQLLWLYIVNISLFSICIFWDARFCHMHCVLFNYYTICIIYNHLINYIVTNIYNNSDLRTVTLNASANVKCRTVHIQYRDIDNSDILFKF